MEIEVDKNQKINVNTDGSDGFWIQGKQMGLWENVKAERPRNYQIQTNTLHSVLHSLNFVISRFLTLSSYYTIRRQGPITKNRRSYFSEIVEHNEIDELCKISRVLNKAARK